MATAVWERLVSLPLFPGMRPGEIADVADTVRAIAREHTAGRPRGARP